MPGLLLPFQPLPRPQPRPLCLSLLLFLCLWRESLLLPLERRMRTQCWVRQACPPAPGEGAAEGAEAGAGVPPGVVETPNTKPPVAGALEGLAPNAKEGAEAEEGAEGVDAPAVPAAGASPKETPPAPNLNPPPLGWTLKPWSLSLPPTPPPLLPQRLLRVSQHLLWVYLSLQEPVPRMKRPAQGRAGRGRQRGRHQR